MTSLDVGELVPRRGNAFTRAIGRGFLGLLGWKLEGEIPNLPKMVLIGAPHTTNWDGILAIATLTALGLRSGTMIKDSAFKGPLGWLLRLFGAIPISRSSPKGVVEQSVDAFTNHEQLLLLIAPEGTRHSAPEWKRGFHHIAAGAGVPILPAAIDYPRKRIRFGPPLFTSSDFPGDMAQLMRFYGRYSEARHPARVSRPISEAMGRSWKPSDTASRSPR